jgi:hypothetical protein
MHLFLTLLYFLIFCILLWKIPFFQNLKGLSAPFIVIFFGLKVLSGSVLILVYTYYYTDPEYADVYKYFNDGRIMFTAIYSNPLDYLRLLTGIDSSAPHLHVYYDQMSFWYRPWESAGYNDNRLVIRFNALISVFSFGYIHVHNVFINFLSFSGLIALYKFFVRYADQQKLVWLAGGMFLFPGLLFWGSGILKEGLLIWSFGFWIYYVDSFVKQKSGYPKLLFLLLLYSFVLLLLKPYTLLLWLPCMIAFYWGRNQSYLIINIKYVTILVLFLVSALLIGFFIPAYNFLEIIAQKQNDFVESSIYFDAGSIIHTQKLSPTFLEISSGFFIGIVHTFFRPHIFEADSMVIWMAALENLLIFAMILFMIIFFDKKKFLLYDVKWAGLWFALLLFGFVGMISVAYGGIVRYKIPALPFLWLFVVHSTNLPELNILKIKNKLKILG